MSSLADPPREYAPATSAPLSGTSEPRLAAVAWAGFQPRTVAIAEAFSGEAVFVSSRLRGHRALLPARYVASAARTWRLLTRRQPRRVVVITPPVLAPLVAWAWCRLHRRPRAD